MTRRTMAVVGAFALAGAVAGCASSPAVFLPVAGAGRAGPTRQAAKYDVRVGGEVVGDVAVWSEGALRGDEEPFVDVRLRIHNRSKAPVELDLRSTRVDVQSALGSWTIPTPDLPRQAAVVQPETTGGLAIPYPLPDRVKPTDVQRFAVRWTVITAHGDYRQTTEFMRADPRTDAAQLPCTGMGIAPGYGCTPNGEWDGYDYEPANDPGLPLTPPTMH